ncbi:MAG: hypothetical protein ABC542_02165 [Candidatus Methanosuratincola petrocarbonis]
MAKRGRKGVSTVIGMAIFLIIFAMAVSYTFVWTQYFSDYGNAVKGQIEFAQQRGSERLEVAVIKNVSGTFLNVTNPTGNVIVVSQIWSGHNNITGEWGVPPFGYKMIDVSAIDGGEEFKAVTTRGNLFSGKYSPPGSPMEGRWLLKWYNSTGDLGVSYLDDLNINMRWYKGVTGTIGFNATAKLVALNESAVVLIKLPAVEAGVELNITIAGQEKVKPSIIHISNLTVGKTYDVEIRMRTNDAVDMDLSLTFIGLDFAKD